MAIDRPKKFRLQNKMVDWIKLHDKTTVAELSAVVGVGERTIKKWAEEKGYYTVTTVHKF